MQLRIKVTSTHNAIAVALQRKLWLLGWVTVDGNSYKKGTQLQRTVLSNLYISLLKVQYDIADNSIIRN